MSLWEKDIDSYINCVNKDNSDSFYLRDKGVKPNIVELAGDLTLKTVLDIGSGDGWVHKTISSREAFECDVIRPDDAECRLNFSVQSVSCLEYEDNKFDTIIASLMLMWLEDLSEPLREINRVAKSGGDLIICITTPYFYRTGKVLESGSFLLEKDLSASFRVDDLYIAGKVGPFEYHYHPLVDYLNKLIASGWSIVEVRDWYIDIEDYNRCVNTEDSEIGRSGNVPLYTFIKSVKQ